MVHSRLATVRVRSAHPGVFESFELAAKLLVQGSKNRVPLVPRTVDSADILRPQIGATVRMLLLIQALREHTASRPQLFLHNTDGNWGRAPSTFPKHPG